LDWLLRFYPRPPEKRPFAIKKYALEAYFLLTQNVPLGRVICNIQATFFVAPNPFMNKFFFSRISALALWFPAFSFAQTTWKGDDLSPFWSEGLNWSGNVVPLPSLTRDLAFAGTKNLQPFNDLTPGSNFRNITFVAGAGAFTLEGNSITLNGNLTNLSSVEQTIAMDMALGSGTRQINLNGGNIRLLGNLTALSSGGLAVRGGNQLFLQGNTLSTGIAGLTVENGAVMQMNNVNVSTGGGVVIGASSAGTVRFQSGTWNHGSRGEFRIGQNLGQAGRLEVGGTGEVAILTVNKGTFTREYLFLNSTTITSGSSNAELILGSGGILSTSRTLAKSGTSSANHTGRLIFDGGTLQAESGVAVNSSYGWFQPVANGSNFPLSSVLIRNGGATFDTNGQDIAIRVNMTADPSATDGAVTKLGSGVLSLYGNNDFRGRILLEEGALQKRSAGALGVTSPEITVNATLDLYGWDTTLRNLDGGGSGLITSSRPLLPGNLTLQNSLDTEYFGSIEDGLGGSLSLIKTGVGRLALAGVGTHTGTTTVLAGELSIQNSRALQNSLLVLGPDGSATFGDLGEIFLGALSGSNSFDMGNNIFRVGSSNASSLFSGNLLGGPGSSLIKEGTGIFTLSGTNSYLGPTFVNEGILLYQNVAAKAPGLTTALAGTAVGLGTGGGGFYSASDVANLFANTLAGFNMLAGSSVGVDTTEGDLVLDTILAGDRGLIKLGSNRLTLAESNTFTGDTVVLGGQLALTHTNALQNSVLDIGNSSADVIFSGPGGQTFNLGNLRGSGSLDIGNNILAVGNNNLDNTFSGSIVGLGGSLEKIGSGNLILLGGNTYSGGTLVSAGRLTVTTASLPSGDITNQAELVIDQSFAGSFTGNISGNGLLVKNGTGHVTLLGNNSYLGGTSVNGGRLIGNTSSLQGDILNLSAVEFNQTGNGSYDGVMSGTGLLLKSGAGGLALTQQNELSGVARVVAGELNLAHRLALYRAILDTGAAGTTGNIVFTDPLFTDYQVGGLQGQRNLSLAGIQLEVGSNNADTVFSGALTGAGGSLIKEGNGILTLLGANTYTGPTIINAGALAGNSTSLRGAITNNSSLLFDQASSGIFSGLLTGGGSLTKQGGGTLLFNTSHAYSGETIIRAGTLAVSVDGALGTADNGTRILTGGVLELRSVNYTTPETIALEGGTLLATTGNSTLAGPVSALDASILSAGSGLVLDLVAPLSGNGALTKSGAGTLRLSAENPYSGNITLQAGILELNHTAALASAGLNASASILAFGLPGANTYEIGALTGSLAINLDANFLRLGGTNTNFSYNGNFSGTGGIEKTGTGTLTLLGTNHTYTGGTIVTGGTLAVNTATLKGNLTNNATVFFEQALNGTYEGVMSGNGIFIKSGEGTLSLTANNSGFTGRTALRAGAIRLLNTLALAGSTLDFEDFGRELVLGLPGQNTYTLGGLQGNATSANNMGIINLGSGPSPSSLIVGANNQDSFFNGRIFGTGGLTKAGSGTLTLFDDFIENNVSTHSGVTLVENGVLALAGRTGNNYLKQSTLDTGSNPGASVAFATTSEFVEPSTSTFTPMTYRIGGLQGSNALDLSSSDLSLLLIIGGNNQSTVFSGDLTGFSPDLGDDFIRGAQIRKVGSGTLTLLGNSSFDAFASTNPSLSGFLIEQGSLVGTSNSLNQTIFMEAGSTLVFDQAVTGIHDKRISGGGNLIKRGVGELILRGSNIYTGTTTIENGLLVVDSLEAVSKSSVIIGQSGSVILGGEGRNFQFGSISGVGDLFLGPNSLSVGSNNSSRIYSGNLSGAGSLTKEGAGTLTLLGNNSYAGGTFITGGTLLGNTDSLRGAIAVIGGNSRVIFDMSNFDGTYESVLSGNGVYIKRGENALTLTQANPFSGTTLVEDGRLVLRNRNALAASTVFVQQSATLGLVLGGNYVLGGLAGSGTVNLTKPDNVTGPETNLTIGNNEESTAFTGNLVGTGSITKVGGGQLSLFGINTYTGGTFVEEGFLVGDTRSLQGEIEVESGATLVFNQISNGTFSGQISGEGNFIKSERGTLVLASDNSYTGSTQITSGELIIAPTGSISSNNNVVVTGSNTTLTVQNAQTLASLSMTENTRLNVEADINVTGTLNLLGGNVIHLTIDNSSPTGFAYNLTTDFLRIVGEVGDIEPIVFSLTGDALNPAFIYRLLFFENHLSPLYSGHFHVLYNGVLDTNPDNFKIGLDVDDSGSGFIAFRSTGIPNGLIQDGVRYTAVAPEPGQFSLLLIAALVFWISRRRHRVKNTP